MEPFRLYRRLSHALTREAVRGFTLVELLIVLLIISVLSIVVLSSQSSFNKTLVLSNTAYDIALTIRSAETFGLGSRAVGVITNTGYGINFQKTITNSFTLFNDSYPLPSTTTCHPIPDPANPAPDAKAGNCSYDSSQSEKLTSYNIGNGIRITDFCAYTGSWACANSNGSTLNSLDIVFVRSSSEPFMTANAVYSSVTPVTAACITLTAPQGGASRFVSIGASGEITANAASCP